MFRCGALNCHHHRSLACFCRQMAMQVARAAGETAYMVDLTPAGRCWPEPAGLCCMMAVAP